MAAPQPRHWAEAVARRHLEGLGWRILGANVVSRGAELDLVARDGDTVVFVEVRQRRNARFGHPAETLDRRKLARLRAGAARYLHARGWSAETPQRIDVVLVLGPRAGHTLTHLRDVA